mgnify:CR=1 FL=1
MPAGPNRTARDAVTAAVLYLRLLGHDGRTLMELAPRRPPLRLAHAA